MRAYLIAAGLLFAVAAVLTLLLLERFAVLREPTAPRPVTVTAARASLESWRAALDAVGSIRAVRGVEVAAETSGQVTAVAVQSGESVRRGQLLVTLNDRVQQAALERQRATLDLARLLFERDASLIEQKSIPQSQYDRSRADLQVAAARLAELEARSDTRRIRAPFDGTLGVVRVRVGDYLEAGDAVAALQDLSELEVDLTVPARYAPQLRPGLSAVLQTAAWPGRDYRARLSAIDVSVDASTRNLLLRARLEETQGLLPGMFASLRIDLGETVARVTVPETAVTASLQGDLVYRLQEGEDGLAAEPRVVTTGAVRGGRIAILSGLEAGDRVVSSGQNKLYRGARVLLPDGAGRP